MSANPLGVDVSSHQGSVDWAAVAGSGTSFAFVKASGGNSYVNPYLSSQANGARNAGLTLGFYHFAWESSLDGFPGAGPEAEAAHFCDTIAPFGLQAGELVALDVEDVAAYGDLSDWCLRWLRAVEQRVGFRPLFYSGSYFIAAHGLGIPALGEYGLWLAAYQATIPPTPQPWPIIAFWQWTDRGNVPGVVGYCDRNVFNGDAGQMASYGKPGTPVATPPIAPAGPVYVYNPNEPAHPQENDWSCSQDAAEWALWAYGQQPGDDWMEASMQAAGVIDPSVGLTDASGAGLARWLNDEYGELGYVSSNTDPVTFDDVAAEAAEGKHPLMIGGRGWYHWSGCSQYDSARDVLILKNPAGNWMGVGSEMDRDEFARLGAFSLVRLTCPATENAPPPPEQNYAPPGSVGSGILDAMHADGVEPSMPSAFLPLGASPAMAEWCIATDGTMYVWQIPMGALWKYPASG